jgi:hypothetical protein
MNDNTKAIITGSVRSLMQLVPIAGGPLAQAWSEYESHSQNKRIEEFFDRLTTQLRALESSHKNLESLIRSMPDVAELLEKSVAAAQRESSADKRQYYSSIYRNFLAAPHATTPDERIDIINHVEQLTETDIELLLKFFNTKHGIMRGDMITDTINVGCSTIGQQDPDGDWLQKYGNIVHSIAKLESRGLLYTAFFNGYFAPMGDGRSSFNNFRKKAWQITPIAEKLIDSMKTDSQI